MGKRKKSLSNNRGIVFDAFDRLYFDSENGITEVLPGDWIQIQNPAIGEKSGIVEKDPEGAYRLAGTNCFIINRWTIQKHKRQIVMDSLAQGGAVHDSAADALHCTWIPSI